MQSQFRHIIRQKISDSLVQAVPVLTRRDVWIPAVPGKAVAVIGMRRAGKTCMLWQVLADRLAAGAHRSSLLYFSFEDERLAGMQASDLDLVVEEYFLRHPEHRGTAKTVFFLDEIQLVPGWETFVRRILDTENIDVFLSGSSARMLSREIASSMRGRAMEAVVRPFSFTEALRHAGQEPVKAMSPDKQLRSTLNKALLAFLESGGFPEAQALDQRSRMELLRTYVDVVLLRDIIERHDISHPQCLRWMVRQLLGNPAGGFSVNKFHNDLKSQGMAIGKDKLHAYLEHLEDSFLLRSLSLATDSIRRRQVNPRKVYPVDTGLIALFNRSGKAQTGHALETAVLHELERHGAEVAYVKTESGYEVDFHARLADGTERLVQVSADIDAPSTLEREVRALTEAAQSFPHASLHLVTLARPAGRIHMPDSIEIAEASDWLLQ
jgi:predicted AAA+ superfamily ATPase